MNSFANWKGDSVGDVLSYVEYDLKMMVNRLKRIAEDSIKLGYIKAERPEENTQRVFTEGTAGIYLF